ncbi:MAG: hypothetical protein RLZZ169_2113 [Pseudomonadota bacterium]|jgi:DnaK suppressor protein
MATKKTGKKSTGAKPNKKTTSKKVSASVKKASKPKAGSAMKAKAKATPQRPAPKNAKAAKKPKGKSGPVAKSSVASKGKPKGNTAPAKKAASGKAPPKQAPLKKSPAKKSPAKKATPPVKAAQKVIKAPPAKPVKAPTSVPAPKTSTPAAVVSGGKAAGNKSAAVATPTPVKTSIPIMSSKPTPPPTPVKAAAPKAKPKAVPVTPPSPGEGIASPLQAATKGFVPYVMDKGEEYMNDRQKDHFRKILLHWRDELMQEVDRTVHHMQDEAANPPDPADRATLEEEFSLELRTRDRERRLIKKIDSTIEAIANDDYGYCETCGVEIGIRRLEARPTANKCIDCKTLDEIKEKQIGGA